ncbi:MAG: hypothetical protein JNK61_07350 [Bacteroidia bacterium]|nr:hypothetical protein [Bacteroidia bacterium]HQV00034.1 hypothetical protein [Bacteroidia bacterium]
MKSGNQLQNGMRVSMRISDKTPLGYTVLIDDMYEGLLYHNEIFEPIKVGDVRTGFIKLIRADGKIDVALQQQGYLHIEENFSLLLTALQSNNGMLPLGDKSTPNDIKQQLGLSKKAFKKMAGYLYKQKIIVITDFEIKLLKP